MSDLNIIKSRYRNMTDGELMTFTLEDGTGLTTEAFGLLKNEFLERKLDISVLFAIEDGTFLQYKESIKNIENRSAGEFSNSVLVHALNEKRDGRINDEIIGDLVETGMEDPDARILVSQLERHARLLYSRANTTMLSAAFIFIAGIAVYMIKPYKPVVTILDILFVCAIGFGLIKFLKGWFDKNKYATVIKNIENDSSQKQYP